MLRGAPIATLGVRHLEFSGGPMDLAGSTQVAYLYSERPGGKDLSIGVMVAGNSGRPGGGIYNPWFSSPQQRLQGVHPGHRTQEHSILSSWLVGSERPAPHIRSSENGILFPRQTYENMEDRFLRCLHRKWGMVENDVKAFKGFAKLSLFPYSVLGLYTADYATSDLSARNIWACEEPALEFVVPETVNASSVFRLAAERATFHRPSKPAPGPG